MNKNLYDTVTSVSIIDTENKRERLCIRALLVFNVAGKSNQLHVKITIQNVTR